jgi:hypothetical protein
VLALIALSLTGTFTQCPWHQLVVEIPDFETAGVQGLQLWRADEEDSETLVEAGRVVFGDRILENGVELLEYTMVDAEDELLEFWSPFWIERAHGDGEAVIIRIIFAGWTEPPGWVRVSSFNAAGESGLSANAVFVSP